MSDKIITNENYIKSLFKSHKEIRDSYLSRYSQAVERINEMENEVIYSTSVPGMDYSNTSINTSSINDSTFNAVSKLDKFRKTESIYKELSWLRTKLDEIDIIFDIYRSLQTHIPIHYEITNHLYYLDESYDYCEAHFGRTTVTIKTMANTTISLVCRFFNDGISAKEINEMSVEQFSEYVGEELYIKIQNKEMKTR